MVLIFFADLLCSSKISPARAERRDIILAKHPISDGGRLGYAEA
jgi:hypothetical protein